MSETAVAISLENVGKRYRLGHRATQIDATEALKQVLRRSRGSRTPEAFWALRGVDARVEKGSILGLVGPNGAGKSTLLKLLARVAVPTEGRITIRGRVASLLEVGTGFHPELTGRDNIYLNGAILGMSRAEIAEVFDTIVDFAGTGKFLDTPIKRYSTGMYVRLGFAVAAHLRADVLLVDEVLAVGDSRFQRRCLGKIGEVTREGRTVVVVSHDMSVVRNLCQVAWRLEGGRLVDAGPASDVVDGYVAAVADSAVREAELTPDREALVAATGVTVHSSGRDLIDVDDQVTLEIDYEVRDRAEGVDVGVRLVKDGAVAFISLDVDVDEDLLAERAPGRYRARVELPRGLLKAGQWSVDVRVAQAGVASIQHVENVVGFEVHELDRFAEHRGWARSRPGLFIVEIPWRTEWIASEGTIADDGARREEPPTA